jgi:hypothetical protein
MKRSSAADRKLDKWFQSHAPQFEALGAPIRNIKFTCETIPFNKLMRQFNAARSSGNRQQAEAILDKLCAAFGIRKPQGKLERDVEIAILFLAERKPTISEIFQTVYGWDKSYTKMGVYKVIRRRKLDLFISAGKPGRPPKN